MTAGRAAGGARACRAAERLAASRGCDLIIIGTLVDVGETKRGDTATGGIDGLGERRIEIR